jgi:O-succinylhomoserine sulfhydrylase
MPQQFDFETLAVRAGISRTPFHEHAEPLFLTSSFVFDNRSNRAKV